MSTSLPGIPRALVDKEGVSFAEAGARVIAFEALLRKHGIVIQSGSTLETIALSVFGALYQRDSPLPVDAVDVRTELKHLIGINELSSLVLSVAAHPEFEVLLPHLRLLNDGVGIQNMPAPQTDQATNKVFELFAGVFALHSGTQIELESEDGKKRNPDVLFTSAGRRWGIACKCLHSNHSEAFISNIEKAIDQIEKSPADTGIVLLSIKNLLDQSRYWSVTNPAEVQRGEEPMLSAFLDPQAPFTLLVQDARAIGEQLQSYLPTGYLESAFRGKKCLPGFAVWAHVVTAIVSENRPIPTSARVMTWTYVGQTSDRDMVVVRSLHDAAYRGDTVRALAT